MGAAAPSSMYMGVQTYGSSVFNGASVPPYDVPFSGGSAYHYNYGSRFSGGSPYRPLHISAPPPYSSGSIMRSGISFLHISMVYIKIIIEAIYFLTALSSNICNL